jgi:hypothetical protein
MRFVDWLAFGLIAVTLVFGLVFAAAGVGIIDWPH